MSEQLPVQPVQPLIPASTPFKLWSAGLIGFFTFFLGFPGGLVLASINWIRMRLTNKAIAHLVGGVVGISVIVIILYLLPGKVGYGLGFLVNVGMYIYLRNQMKKDIDAFKADSHEVINAHWFGGCLLSLAAIVVYFAMAIVIVLFLTLLGVPSPK